WRPSQRGGHHIAVRDIARYAAALAVIDGAMTLFSRLDVLLIGAYLGAADAGRFEAPLRITILVGYVGAALAAGVTPGLAKGIRDEEAVTRLHSSLRLLIVFQAAVLAPLVVW